MCAVAQCDLPGAYTEKYTNSANFSIIDHVVVRNAVPTGGDVIDNHLFELYPDGPGGTNEDARILANLQITGSDHFPLWGTVTF